MEGKANGAPLQHEIISGIGWSFAQLLVSQGFGFMTKLILARLLLPEHFGIIGMAIVFTGLINTINDLGMAAALIQFKQERLRRIHYDTVFWLSILFSLGTFVLLIVAIGPFAAWFYGEPMLTLVISVIGISVCLNPLNLVHRVQLTRELNFKALGIISSIGSVVAGVGAIALALMGAGVWSIVAQSVIATLVSIPLMWRTTRWWPRFQFSKAALRDVVGFGVYDALVRMAVFFTKNIDYLLIGWLLGAELLGIYTLAFLLTDTFRQQLMGVLNKVMFPVYGRLQDDITSVKTYYLQVIKYNTLVITPIMLLLLAFADPIVPWFFGEEWRQAIFPAQAMAVASIIHAVGGTSSGVLKGIGRVDLDFKIYVFNAVFIVVPAFYIGIYFYGICGAAIAVVIQKLSSRLIYQYYIRKLAQVYEWDIIQAAKPSFFGGILFLLVVFLSNLFSNEQSWVSFLAIVFLAGISYSLAAFIFVKSELQMLAHAIFKKKKVPTS